MQELLFSVYFRRIRTGESLPIRLAGNPILLRCIRSQLAELFPQILTDILPAKLDSAKHVDFASLDTHRVLAISTASRGIPAYSDLEHTALNRCLPSIVSRAREALRDFCRVY